MQIRKAVGAGIAAVVIVLGVSAAAQAAPVSVSAGCISGPGSPTCFRPNVHIGSDPTGNVIPLFVEVSLPGGHADLASAEAAISMQANLVGQEFISLVSMNLDPLVSPADITITFHASTGGAGAPTISDGVDNQGGSGFFGFDISWDFPTSNGGASTPRFNNNDLVTFRVDCAGPSCGNFNVNSFNFTELSDQGNSGQGEFRICARVQGIGANGEGSDKVCGVAAPVPEPATLSLLGLGVIAVAFAARGLRRK